MSKNPIAAMVGICLALGLVAPAGAAEKQSRKDTWSGYLWTDQTGKLRKGNAILALKQALSPRRAA